ncbi:LuxR family transcriptional regulator [Actinokineospora xionganensis]|uniref:AAA family ATPase n=1 Tax=Actinokineospora xionganensis TaxID=2684470 RepID=A0ABR7LEE2_9PSEU|nr:LuxR family transcriptional regulator [Actinokineospora xionganensis]MBC6450878.1 AAA family ATPase [Actinokineospora xionganensis]
MPGRRIPTIRRVAALVGRSAELAEVALTVRRPPSVVLIEGEAGVGKTRLVRELLRGIAPEGRAVLFGTCQPMRAPLPYGPVVDILRDTRTLLEGVAATLSPLAGALRPLLPELAPLLPPEPSRGDVATERHQVFRAVREVLAAFGPTLLVVEDVHWADEGTQDLLRFLTCPPTPNLSVVLTYRRESHPTQHGTLLPGGAHVLLAEGRNTLVRLRPLQPGHVGQLAADLLGTERVPDDFARELHRRTAGIPFVVEELLREVREGGLVPRPRALDEVDIPILLRDTLADRLARLGPAVTTVVQAAAVLDTAATEADLAAVAGLTDDGVEAALTHALDGAVLHEVGAERYALRHPLATQAVYVSIPGPLRRRMHARAADLLAAAPGSGVVRLAHHHRQAGDLANWVRRTLAAVDHATQVGDTALALQVLEAALADDALPVRDRNTLAVRLSRVVINGIAGNSTVERLRSVLREETLGPRARGEVRLNLGLLLMNQVGRVEDAQGEIEMALHDLDSQPALAARGYAALTLPFTGTRPVRDHLRWLAEALRIADSTPIDDERLMAVRSNEVTVLAQLGDPAAWTAAGRLPRPGRSVKIRRQLARAHINLADAAAWLGHHDRARESLVTGRELLSETDVPFLSMLATGTELRLDSAAGRWTSLEQDGAQLIDQAGDMAYLAADAWLALGWLAIARGDRDTAIRHLDHAHAAALENAPICAAIAAGRVTLALTRGDVAAAAVGVERALAAIRHKGNWLWAADLLPPATRALLRTGRAGDAAAIVTEFDQGIEGRDAPLACAALDLCRGLLATGDEAVDRFTRAAKQYHALPQPHTAAVAYELAGNTAVDLGDIQAALPLLDAAASAFTELGLTKDAARCVRLSRRFRQGAPRGRKSYGGNLSPREREVVDLVAAGKTNRQVAEALFLSTRTVEKHVGQAMRKLGLSSRAEFTGMPLSDPEE